MPDMSLIGSAVASLKTAGDIAQSFLQLKTMADVQAKVIDLQNSILTAQQSALAANAEQFSMLERIRELEKQLAELESWKKTEERYELRVLPSGGFVFALKPGCTSTEPAHCSCDAIAVTR